jgi:hypothetical protein
MYTLDRTPVNSPLKPWQASLELPMANQVRHLKDLMLSKNYFSRIPAQEMVLTTQEDDEHYVIATRGSNGDYAFIYFPTGRMTELSLSSLQPKQLIGSWYDPRTGVLFPYNGPKLTKGKNSIKPPSSGKGHDWILIVE